MIADYFNNFELGTLISGGNSGNAGNTNDEAPNNGALPVTTYETADKAEPVTGGISKRSVTDVTCIAEEAVTAPQPATPRIDTASAAMLPPLPLLPHQRPCYCCKGIDYWLAGTKKYPHWICRKCHPPAPGAERKL
jgi:hypothetical protein